jgi:hypothetical protein
MNEKENRRVDFGVAAPTVEIERGEVSLELRKIILLKCKTKSAKIFVSDSYCSP